MKNHIRINGQLLQTNKKWGALKQSQRTWIQEMTAKEHAAYVNKYDKLPMKKSKKIVLDKVHDHIDERSIWIPYGEFKSHVSVMIDKLNRKNPLYNPPVNESKPTNPAPPKTGIEEFPENVQIEIKEKIEKLIKSYISQAHRVPSDKVCAGHIKNVLRGFNAKQRKLYEKRIAESDVLLSIYDELRKQNIQ